MANVNKVFLLGNLTRDPELRVTPGGTAVANFALAINHRWKDQDGNDREEVAFVECTAWGRTADTIAKYVQKGAPLFVEGRLKFDQWEDKETSAKRSKLSVVVGAFQFIPTGSASRDDGYQGDAQDDHDQAPPPRRGAPPARNAPPPRRSAPPPAQEPLDEDVPF